MQSTGKNVMAGPGNQLYENAAQEDRSAERERISIPASLRASGGKSYQTVVRDLSMSGFSATAMSRLHPGTYCWLTLPSMASMTAKVIWWDEGLVGCAFENLIAPVIYENLMERWRRHGHFSTGS